MDIVDFLGGFDYSLGNALSYHTDRSVASNEIHPSFSAKDYDRGIGFGAYKNSEGNLSLYGGLVGQLDPFWWELGAATGYSGAPVVPFGRVGVDINDNMRAFLAPSYDQHDGRLGAVLGLEGTIAEW